MSRLRRLVAVAESNKASTHCQAHPKRIASHQFDAWDGKHGMCEECASKGRELGYEQFIERMQAQVEDEENPC